MAIPVVTGTAILSVIETRKFSDRSEYSHNRAELVLNAYKNGETTMRYQITSNDPGTYTSPYTREMIFDSTDGDIFEFTCHMGITVLLICYVEREKRSDEKSSPLTKTISSPPMSGKSLHNES